MNTGNTIAIFLEGFEKPSNFTCRHIVFREIMGRKEWRYINNQLELKVKLPNSVY